LLDEEFKTDLAKNAKAEGEFRGDDEKYSTSNLTDGNSETYWALDDDKTSGSVEIDLGKSASVKYIVLQEYIKLGQRVKSFSVDVWRDGDWVKVAEATTIGHKRILKIEPIETSKIRINILSSKACPVISSVEVY
jgi:alpha-L-fucosidase